MKKKATCLGADVWFWEPNLKRASLKRSHLLYASTALNINIYFCEVPHALMTHKELLHFSLLQVKRILL